MEETARPSSVSGLPVASYDGTERIGYSWLVGLIVFNSMLDSPLSDTFGPAWRFLGEILTTGFAFAVFIAMLVSRGTSVRARALWIPIVCFLAYCIVQGFILHVHPFVVGYAARGILRFPMVALGAFLVARSPERWSALARLLLTLAAIESGLLIVQYFTIDLPIWEMIRPSEDVDLGFSTVSLSYSTAYPNGTFPRYNYAAEFLLPIAFLALVLYRKADPRERPGTATVLLILSGTTISCSRTAQLCLLVGAALLFLRKNNLLLVASALGAIIFVSYLRGGAVDYAESTATTNVVDRYLSFFSPSYWEQLRDGGDLQRWPAAIEGTIQTLDRYPLMGTGYGTIGNALTDSAIAEQPDAGYVQYNRLDWLEDRISLRAVSDVGWVCLLAQGGILGLFFFGSILHAFYKACRTSALARSLAGMTMLAFLAFNVSSGTYLSRSFLSSAAVILGLAVARSLSDERPSTARSTP